MSSCWGSRPSARPCCISCPRSCCSLRSGSTSRGDGSRSHAARWRCVPRLPWPKTILFLKSQTGISIYSDRYLLPLLTVTILSLAGFLQLVLPRKLTLAMGNPGAAVVALAVMIPCCVFAFRQQDLYWLYPRKGLVERLTAGIPNGSPVLTTSLPPFLLLSHYDRDRRVLYLLDTKRNLGGDTPSGDFYTQRLLTNWTRAGYNTRTSCHAMCFCHRFRTSTPWRILAAIVGSERNSRMQATLRRGSGPSPSGTPSLCGTSGRQVHHGTRAEGAAVQPLASGARTHRSRGRCHHHPPCAHWYPSAWGKVQDSHQG